MHPFFQCIHADRPIWVGRFCAPRPNSVFKENRAWALAFPCPVSGFGFREARTLPKSRSGGEARSGTASGRLGTMTILPDAAFCLPALGGACQRIASHRLGLIPTRHLSGVLPSASPASPFISFRSSSTHRACPIGRTFLDRACEDGTFGRKAGDADLHRHSLLCP